MQTEPKQEIQERGEQDQALTIGACLEVLEVTSKRLHGIYNELCSRVEPILTPEDEPGPESAVERAPYPRQLSPFSTRLDDLNHELDLLGQRIHSLTSRVEL